MRTYKPLIKGTLEKIGSNDSRLKLKYENIDDLEIAVKITTHNEGLEYIFNFLVNSKYKIIDSLSEIDAIGHRIVHGGEKFKESVLITDAVIDEITACIPIAPLHNPANLYGIKTCLTLMPTTPQIAVFDTSFHQTIPKKAFLYGLPYELYQKYGIRRYGFHGISHQYVAQTGAQKMHKELASLKLITCHLGNGASVTAINGGKSIDTSMGFTPLQGLTMGTRSGEIDPAIVPFIMDHEDMTAKQIYQYLNNQSGVLGISGLSSDFRDLETAAVKGNKRADIALDVFTYQVQKFIGSYIMALDGLDAIIFTAGIGENSPYIRNKIASKLDYLNIYLDSQKNIYGPKTREISTITSSAQLWIIPTNEEIMIAKETQNICLRLS
jgi:acetate kinase